MQRRVTLALFPAAMVVNGICLSQTPGAGGAMLMAGSLVTAGVAQLDMPRRVMIKCAADETARTFTITGTEKLSGKTISETIAGPNATSVSSLKDYWTVTSVKIDAASAGAITVGTTDGTTAGSSTPVLSSAWIPTGQHTEHALIGMSGIIKGTVNYGAEHTMDDPFYGEGTGGSALSQDTYLNPFVHATLTNKAVSAFDNYNYPVSAVRCTVKSYSGTGGVTFNFVFAR